MYTKVRCDLLSGGNYHKLKVFYISVQRDFMSEVSWSGEEIS
jgi:hypothetical protein